jgi:RNA polymerase-binding transcription factor DksA
MNQQLTLENKAKLLAEQKRIRGILAGEGKLDGKGEFPGEYKPNFPAFGDGEDENANEVAAYETNLGIKRDLEARLTKVESALEWIEQGTYGKCKEGDEIEEERLRAIPEADACLKHSK